MLTLFFHVVRSDSPKTKNKNNKNNKNTDNLPETTKAIRPVLGALRVRQHRASRLLILLLLRPPPSLSSAPLLFPCPFKPHSQY